MNKAFLIIDYNNIRFTDVQNMANYVTNKHQLRSVLIRQNPEALDYSLVDYVIDLNFSAPDFTERSLQILQELELHVVGGFVFSDKAMIAGTELLTKLGVPADTITGAKVALNKYQFRKAELNYADKNNPPNYWRPAFCTIKNKQEAEVFLSQHSKGVVLKPTSEGNNRGVVVIKNLSDLEGNWHLVEPYLSAGVMMEELIPFAPEYSFDGVGELNFVTKKISAHGPFPVEIGQQVPSLIPIDKENIIINAGRTMNLLSGSNGGAYHNEVKFDGHSYVAAVEPNRRPAGMCIWDLAEKVYKMNFYHELIEHCLGHPTSSGPLNAIGVATIRMLPSPAKGLWNTKAESHTKILEDCLTQFNQIPGSSEVEVFNFRVIKANQSPVDNLVLNNGDFVAQVGFFTLKSNDDIQKWADAFEGIWKKTTKHLVLQTNSPYKHNDFQNGSLAV